MHRAILSIALLLVIGATGCGSDSSGPADAGDGDGDAATGVDASGPDAGGAGLGRFCHTLPDGGPECQPDLECCAGTLTCRLPEDCGDSTGFIPCEMGSDCPNSKVCCQTTTQTFCTKNQACDAYGGTVIP